MLEKELVKEMEDGSRDREGEKVKQRYDRKIDDWEMAYLNQKLCI